MHVQGADRRHRDSRPRGNEQQFLQKKLANSISLVGISVSHIPFRHSQAKERAPSWYKTTPPTDSRSAASNNRRRTSTRLWRLNLNLSSKASSSISSSELRRDVRNIGRSNDGHGCKLGSQSSRSAGPSRRPFRGRSGGAGNPLSIPVLSSSASVPLSLVVREDLE